MSWPCYIVIPEKQEPPVSHPDHPGISDTILYRTPEGELLPFDKLRVGAVFVDDTIHSVTGKPRGIVVKLPGYGGQNGWHMQEEGSPGNHWHVSGAIPNVTATPSINCGKTYHGFVTNGVVTDDCEGRKFDDFGRAA